MDGEAPRAVWHARGRPATGQLQIPPEPGLSDDFGALLEAWAEREAIAGGERLAHLAAEYESRKAPPAGGDPFGDDAQTDPWPAAAPVPPPRLGLTRAVISTCHPQPVVNARSVSSVDRYLAAGKRVDQAFLVLQDRIRSAAAAARGWSMASAIRGEALDRKLAAVTRRRISLQQCVQGRLQACFFRCTCCGQIKVGEPMTCNHRACPRCVAKLRLANQAKVHRILEHVDATRQQQGRRAARWRFLTLTLPSLPEFRPMRRLFGEAWSRVYRSAAWARFANPTTVLALEVTHSTAGWHVHGHAIVDAFIPRAEMVRAWQLAVLRSFLQRPRDATKKHEERRRTAGDVYLRLRDPRTFAGGMTCETIGLVRQLIRAAERRDEHGGLAWRSEVQHLVAGLVAERDGMERPRYVVMRRQVRRIMAAMPTGAGQHLSHPEGSRETIVRELSKYLGKDLGAGSGDSESDWGIMGTAERGADFLDGIMRWRTLRCYGDALGADLRATETKKTCDDCGSPVKHETTRWLTDEHLQQIEAQKKKRRAERRGEQEPTKEPKAVVKLAPAPKKLDRLLAFWSREIKAGRFQAGLVLRSATPQPSKLDGLVAWLGDYLAGKATRTTVEVRQASSPGPTVTSCT